MSRTIRRERDALNNTKRGDRIKYFSRIGKRNSKLINYSDDYIQINPSKRTVIQIQ